jgi:hypothetical protein
MPLLSRRNSGQRGNSNSNSNNNTRPPNYVNFGRRVHSPAITSPSTAARPRVAARLASLASARPASAPRALARQSSAPRTPRPASAPRALTRSASASARLSVMNRGQRQLDRPVRVDGPYVYARYRLANGATIYMFGEQHRVTELCQPCKLPDCLTMTRLLMSMIDASQKLGKQLDLFFEDHFDSNTGYRFENLTANNMNTKYSTHAHLARAKGLLGRYGKRLRNKLLRVHLIDMRNKHHPPIASLWNRPRRTRAPVRKLVNITLRSNAYKTDLENAGAQVTKRNVTSFGTKSVSRVRKQLLKLPVALRGALIRESESLVGQYMREKYHSSDSRGRADRVSVVLMDVAHLARMLHYAGLGDTSPPNPSSMFNRYRKAREPARVVVSYDGALHTKNLIKLMDAAIASGALDAVKEEHLLDINKCLVARFPVNYGFT